MMVLPLRHHPVMQRIVSGESSMACFQLNVRPQTWRPAGECLRVYGGRHVRGVLRAAPPRPLPGVALLTP